MSVNIKNGIIIDGEVYDLVDATDEKNDCENCAFFKYCRTAESCPCVIFPQSMGKHFKKT